MITQMKTDIARTNMIKQQLKTWNVSDQATLDVLSSTPREMFVPEEYPELAFMDKSIPLAHDQTMMPPKEEGRMLQALKVRARERVLLIGVQAGYMLSVLAKLSLHVYAVDPFDDFRHEAQKKAEAAKLGNFTMIDGDINTGWQNEAPFNAIVITGSVADIPNELLQSLEVGGRFYGVVGNKPNMAATLVTRVSEKQWDTTTLFETDRPRTPNAVEPSGFEF